MGEEEEGVTTTTIGSVECERERSETETRTEAAEQKHLNGPNIELLVLPILWGNSGRICGLVK